MNCKPGYLAYIAICDQPANVGVVVEVMETRIDADTIAWQRIRSRNPMIMLDKDDNECHRSEGWIADPCLRPISGVPVPDEQLDEVRA